MGLKDCIQRDIDRVFMNTEDFCDNLTIQCGTTRLLVIGSLQSNSIQNNSGNSAPLQEISYTLYVKYPLDVSKMLSAGARITINDKSFTVASIADEMGIATIELSTKVGR